MARKLVGSGHRIRIYSRDRPEGELAGLVDYAGCFSHEVLWKKFQEECDASLLVYAFGHPDDDLYRTHFPTKLSEYAWQGMPMVMVGPSHATGIIWGLEHPEACALITRADLEPFLARLKELFENAEARIRIAEAAIEVARKEFDPIGIRARFHQILCEAC